MINVLKCAAASSILAAMYVIPIQASANESVLRLQSASESCDSIQTSINNTGAAVVYYPSERDQSLTLFDKFVSGSSLCKPNENGVQISIATADNPSCSVTKCMMDSSDTSSSSSQAAEPETSGGLGSGAAAQSLFDD
jgi:hypothetical protein